MGLQLVKINQNLVKTKQTCLPTVCVAIEPILNPLIFVKTWLKHPSISIFKNKVKILSNKPRHSILYKHYNGVNEGYM